MSTQLQAHTLEGLEPAAVWQFFADMAAVPRPSKKEERIRRHIHSVATQHGLASKEDEIGNVIITVPSSPGHEHSPVTVLQAHLDMVCEKNSDTVHDFDDDPICLIVDKDGESGERIVRADGTTLGADNGIGVALALAAATEDGLQRPPLELLFTLDEEAGMTGAKGLSSESFRGRRLLNLDSEEDDAIYIGCAGGCDTNLAWRFEAQRPASDGECCRVEITGLRGGHSGGDIHEGRGSAIKLLVRVLRSAETKGLQLGAFQAGSMRNALPREATVKVFGPAGSIFALEEAANVVRQEATRESCEDGVTIHVEPDHVTENSLALSADDSDTLLAGLSALPHGVLGMHPKIAGLVESSNNIATLRSVLSSDGKSIIVESGCLSRSSCASRLAEVLAQIAAIGRLSGAAVATGNEYPGWSPNPDSPTLAVCQRVYSRVFESEPHVLAIHAGLECGLIGERVGGMDMVSFGPRIEGAHSPDERVYIDSVAKSWVYLKAVLAELAGG